MMREMMIRTKVQDIVDNILTASLAQVTIGAKHTHNTTDTPFNKNYDQEKGGEIFDAKVDDYQEKGGQIADYEEHDDQDKGGEIVYK